MCALAVAISASCFEKADRRQGSDHDECRIQNIVAGNDARAVERCEGSERL
jgi:hypothetical protein